MLAHLALIFVAAAPDAGQSVTRTHEVRWLSVPDAGFAARVDAHRFKGGEREATIEVLTLTMLDGGTTPALEKVSAELQSDEYTDDVGARVPSASLLDGSAKVFAELEAHIAQGVSGGVQNITVSVPLARGPFVQAEVCVDFLGPYPSINCRAQRFRVDTGATWSWEEVIARPKHAAFQRLCRARQAEEAKSVRRHIDTSVDGRDDAEWWDQMLAIRCGARDLRDFSVTRDGDLDFTVFRGPHVTGNFTFGFTMKKSELGAWVDVHGPLGKSPR